METKYITIPAESMEVRKRRERKELIWGITQVIIGVACFIGILALLISMAYEPVTVRPMAVYTTSAADLYVIESQNHLRDVTKMINPSPLTNDEWEVLCEVCEDRDIDVSLALGLIWVESRFDPNAVSKAGCYGYCQIHPRWHPAGLSPVENIRYGINYLADLCEAYGSTEAGLTAYNAGRDTGDRSYAKAVFAAAEKWREKVKMLWEAMA